MIRKIKKNKMKVLVEVSPGWASKDNSHRPSLIGRKPLAWNNLSSTQVAHAQQEKETRSEQRKLNQLVLKKRKRRKRRNNKQWTRTLKRKRVSLLIILWSFKPSHLLTTRHCTKGTNGRIHCDLKRKMSPFLPSNTMLKTITNFSGKFSEIISNQSQQCCLTRYLTKTKMTMWLTLWRTLWSRPSSKRLSTPRVTIRGKAIVF